MPWRGPYYYRSERVNGRPRQVYVGSGRITQLAAQWDAGEREQRKLLACEVAPGRVGPRRRRHLLAQDGRGIAPGGRAGPGQRLRVAGLPAVVRDATFLNHLEMQSNPHGHEAGPGNVNPDRNRVPHFDFHFYGIPEEQVWAIPDVRPPLPAVAPERLPDGYTQPGRSVLEMGRHSVPTWSSSDPNFLTTIMILGYLPDGSQMHFLEPMISQETLLGRQDFTLPLPVPQDLGRGAPTLYPTSFNTVFQGNAWTFVLSHFVIVGGAGSAMAVTAASTATPAAQGLPPAGVAFDVGGALAAPGPGAFSVLDVAAEWFGRPPTRVARAVAFKSGDAADGVNIPDGLKIVLNRFQPDAPPVPVSPMILDLADELPPVGQDLTT